MYQWDRLIVAHTILRNIEIDFPFSHSFFCFPRFLFSLSSSRMCASIEHPTYSIHIIRAERRLGLAHQALNKIAWNWKYLLAEDIYIGRGVEDEHPMYSMRIRLRVNIFRTINFDGFKKSISRCNFFFFSIFLFFRLRRKMGASTLYKSWLRRRIKSSFWLDPMGSLHPRNR